MSVITFNMPQAVDFSTVAQLQNNAYNSWNKGIEGLNKTHKDFVSDVKNDNLNRLKALANSVDTHEEYSNTELQQRLKDIITQSGDWIDIDKANSFITDKGKSIYENQKAGIERAYTLNADKYSKVLKQLTDLNTVALRLSLDPKATEEDRKNAFNHVAQVEEYLVANGVSTPHIRQAKKLAYEDQSMVQQIESGHLTNQYSGLRNSETMVQSGNNAQDIVSKQVTAGGTNPSAFYTTIGPDGKPTLSLLTPSAELTKTTFTTSTPTTPPSGNNSSSNSSSNTATTSTTNTSTNAPVQSTASITPAQGVKGVYDRQQAMAEQALKRYVPANNTSTKSTALSSTDIGTFKLPNTLGGDWISQINPVPPSVSNNSLAKNLFNNWGTLGLSNYNTVPYYLQR